MNKFSMDRVGYKMPGVDKPYYDDTSVFWYTNGVIACGPRRLRVREFKPVRWAKKGFRHVNRKVPFRSCFDGMPF